MYHNSKGHTCFKYWSFFLVSKLDKFLPLSWKAIWILSFQIISASGDHHCCLSSLYLKVLEFLGTDSKCLMCVFSKFSLAHILSQWFFFETKNHNFPLFARNKPDQCGAFSDCKWNTGKFRPDQAVLQVHYNFVLSEVSCLFNVVDSDFFLIITVQNGQLLHFTQEHHIPSAGPSDVGENMQHMPWLTIQTQHPPVLTISYKHPALIITGHPPGAD